MTKLCNGVPTDQPTLRESRAYCEGREAAAQGALIGTNPHPASDRDHVLWDSGHASWSADPTGVQTQDCCARAYGGGYTP